MNSIPQVSSSWYFVTPCYGIVRTSSVMAIQFVANYLAVHGTVLVKLLVAHLVKIVPAFCGTTEFITAFTVVHRYIRDCTAVRPLY
jgi:hypothetical protein